MKVPVQLVAQMGDRVLVQNYRKSSRPWEPAEVMTVRADFSAQLGPSVSYRVRLDRRGASGSPIDLYVGPEQLRREGAQR